ncbi:MAG: glycosyltransferase [Paludibacter sp.]|nr:glycosyltransferase [Paludibacter sp.]
MKSNILSIENHNNPKGLDDIKSHDYPQSLGKINMLKPSQKIPVDLSEILVISSYPPRECGIATYSQDLIRALNNKFSKSLSIKVCALETGNQSYDYPEEVKFRLDTSKVTSYMDLAEKINNDNHIKLVLVQHEFGLYKEQEMAFLQFLYELSKPVALVFHTVLPKPDQHLKTEVKNIVAACKAVIVMTNTSANILMYDYGVSKLKISIIPHGTHLVPHLSEDFLKDKYKLTGRKVLTTFGLLSSGKSLETTINALPEIVKNCPEALFLIIGKTHPEVVKHEGEVYRIGLIDRVKELGLQDHVIFINEYLSLNDLLEYLQLTDIYLFTSNDPNQAVSGTFVYAMSCGCPIISTPIPHAMELLSKDTGIIFDFNDSKQLAVAVNSLLNNQPLRKSIITNTLQKIVSTAWENTAVAHAMLFRKIGGDKIKIQYNLPEINLNHLKALTTDVGIIQFSKVNQPDISSGYTLDDNARALVTICMSFKQEGSKEKIEEIRKYLAFIKFCQQPGGNFLNYVDQDRNFTDQNDAVNLDDSNGRALWALGYLLILKGTIPTEIITQAEAIFDNSLLHIVKIRSPRAMAFAIKGIYYRQKVNPGSENPDLIKIFANRLVEMYKHVASEKWEWFESYLTYANSILPEAMLYAWLITKESIYKDIARTSFNFLLDHIFNENGIEVISNKTWLQKGQKAGHFGEQPIDVAYTIMTLSKFYDVLMVEDYRQKMIIAFNWFLGNNRLNQIVYNPCTGGCYDGLEEKHVNLNQGAESTVSYLMARLTIEKYKDEE